jgi:hypothetical protein
MDRVDTKIGFA